MLIISVGVANRLHVERPGFQIPAEGKYFSLLQNVNTNSSAHPVFFSVGTRVKQRERDVVHPPTSSYQVKNEKSYNCTPPIRLRGLDRDIFICIF